MVIDRQGRILTNFHVIDEAREIQVTLYDGKTYDAKIVGQDPASDVAVVQIDAPAADLFPATFGDSTRLHVGQRVFAIGNPFGLERTLTTGIISSLNRSLPSRSQNRTIRSDHPDRRRHQSRQLRRSAVGHPWADDRHEHGHRQPHRRECRRGFRHPRQHHRPGRYRR